MSVCLLAGLQSLNIGSQIAQKARYIILDGTRVLSEAVRSLLHKPHPRSGRSLTLRPHHCKLYYILIIHDIMMIIQNIQWYFIPLKFVFSIV